MTSDAPPHQGVPEGGVSEDGDLESSDSGGGDSGVGGSGDGASGGGVSKGSTYLRSGAATVIGRIAEAGCGFASVWLLNEILGKAAYGDLVLALTVVSFVELLAVGGLDGLIVFRNARRPEPAGQMAGEGLVGTALRYALIAAVLLAACLFVTRLFLAEEFEKPGLALWLGLLALRIPAQAGRALYSAWYRARQRVAESTLIGATAPVLLTTTLIAVVWLADLGSTATALALVSGTLLVSAVWFVRRPVPLLRGASIARADLAYAGKLSLLGVVSRGVWLTDIVLVGYLASSSETAQYGVASKLALLTLFAHQALSAVFTPRMGTFLARDDAEGMGREYAQVRTAALLAAHVFACGACLLGGIILPVFGDYASAYPTLMTLVAAYLVTVSFGTNGGYLNMAGHGGWSLLTALGLLVLNVVLNALWVPRYGALGAAHATLVSLAVLNVLTSLIVWRLGRFATYNGRVAGVTACTVAVLLLVVHGELAPLPGGGLLLGITTVYALTMRATWRPAVGTILSRLGLGEETA